MVIWFEARSKRNDAVIRDLETHLWTFDEAGAVARFRHICDTAQHRAAVG